MTEKMDWLNGLVHLLDDPLTRMGRSPCKRIEKMDAARADREDEKQA